MSVPQTNWLAFVDLGVLNSGHRPGSENSGLFASFYALGRKNISEFIGLCAHHDNVYDKYVHKFKIVYVCWYPECCFFTSYLGTE